MCQPGYITPFPDIKPPAGTEPGHKRRLPYRKIQTISRCRTEKINLYLLRYFFPFPDAFLYAYPIHPARFLPADFLHNSVLRMQPPDSGTVRHATAAYNIFRTQKSGRNSRRRFYHSNMRCSTTNQAPTDYGAPYNQ